jgi:hypothetical protein
VAALLVALAACSSNSGNNNDAGSNSDAAAQLCATAAPLSPDAGATCASPGGVTAGAADTHCDGVPAQPVTMASCSITALEAAAGDDGSAADDAASSDDAAAGDDGGTADAGDIGNCGDPDYGATMFGAQGADDDCKYDVSWTSTPVCTGQPVYFSVTVKNKVDGTPVTCANVRPDVVLACSHPATANAVNPSPETAPGVYTVGPVVFDRSGRWVVRFHIHEDCTDIVPTSPHGHAAFWVTAP